MASLHKFTTKEVLNKVLLDSSGNSVAAFSHTSQEALNAVLDTTNSRLNVSLVGGTISGDVTISGDLTVEGSSSNGNFDEIVQGGLKVQSDANDFIIVAQDAGGGNLAGFYKNSIGDGLIIGYNASHTEKVVINTNGNSHFSGGNVGIGTTSPDSPLHIKSQNTGWDGCIVLEENNDGTANMIVRNEDNLWFGYAPSASDVTSSPVMLMVINESGNVGIGTTSPNAKLEINGGGYSDSLIIKGGASNSGIALKDSDGNTDGFVYADSGNVGFLDADGDWAIRASANTDARFYVAGLVRFMVDANSRISLSNNDSNTGNTVFGKSAFNASSDNASDYNVAIGELAMGNGTVSGAIRNIAIGYKAGRSITSGDENIVIGYEGAEGITTGSNNIIIGNNPIQSNVDNNTGLGHNVFKEGTANNMVGIGYKALGVGTLTTGANGSVGVGYEALKNLTSGSGNTAIGYQSLYAVTTGGNNVAIGAKAGSTQTDANFNTYIGKDAGLNATGSNNTVVGAVAFDAGSLSGSQNVVVGTSGMGSATGAINKCTAIGEGALAGSLTTSGGDPSGTVAVGYQSLVALTTGAGNTALGYEALKTAATEAQSVAIGYQSMAIAANSSNNVMVGYKSGYDLSQGSDNNTGIGHEALSGTHGVGASEKNTAIGSGSMAGAIDGGARNTAIGVYSLKALTSGDNNTAIGCDSLSGVTTGVDNTAIGKNSMKAIIAGAYNIAIGSNAMADYKGDDGNNAGSKNIAIGVSAMEAFQGGTGDVHANTRFDRNIALGYNSFRGTDFNNAEVVVTDNIAIGDEALNSTGANGQVGTIAIGSNALTALTTGTRTTAIGYGAGKALTNCNNNTLLGYETLMTADSGEGNNVVLGASAGKLINNSSSDNNIIIGFEAGSGGTGAMAGCVVVGRDAMKATGSNAQTGTVAIGYETLIALTSGGYNTAIGYQSGLDMTTGNNNTLLGWQTGANIVDGHSNVAIGSNALDAVTSGHSNVGVGRGSGGSIQGGVRNSSLGYNSGDVLVAGEDNTILGYNADASGSSGSHQIVIGSGATGVGDNTAIIGGSNVTDVYMGDNGSAWSTTSDGRLKENVEDWDVGLDAINNLRIVSYNFKKDNPYKYDSDKKRQGIIAQEAQKVLPEMIKDDGEWLSANQEPMIWALVNAVQELSAEVKQLKKQLEDK